MVTLHGTSSSYTTTYNQNITNTSSCYAPYTFQLSLQQTAGMSGWITSITGSNPNVNGSCSRNNNPRLISLNNLSIFPQLQAFIRYCYSMMWNGSTPRASHTIKNIFFTKVDNSIVYEGNYNYLTSSVNSDNMSNITALTKTNSRTSQYNTVTEL